ncbi:MAG: tRNA (N6-isopentenyl adenosine(37)-C2)-methylthiotransferase MiaB, partial [Thermodesulfobacteriota bacterium]|nr:tRNA (N6-isopentenyl adenosine(37)-C2)-methylthiotransferase MiaB [Thermodesulfobacteriota bacterium]
MICNKESPKKVYIRTFGCQMNEYDTERMISILKGCEYISEEDPANADLIILNTCTVREKAAQKVYSMLGRFKKLKRENEDLIIGVGGCLAQQEGWKLVEKAPVVDMVFGPHTIPDLCKLVFLAESKEAKVIATNEAHKKVFSVETFTRGERATAFVSIMQGCDKYCSYCIVPYVRGREVSRSPEEILLEIRCLADSGVKEVTLLGQNVNSYGKSLLSGIRFSDLLYLVCNIEGIKRVRFVTSHPKDLDDDLIMAFSQLNKLCNHFHLPLQSGSNKILRAMGRHYTAEEYIEKVNKIRMVRPAIAITTDIIVGFP